MIARFSARVSLFSILFLLSVSIVWGQADTSIRGVVTDPSGAIIPRAQAKLTNTATGLERRTASDDSGEYEMRQVPSGPYRLNVEAPGFKKYEASALKLQCNS